MVRGNIFDCLWMTFPLASCFNITASSKVYTEWHFGHTTNVVKSFPFTDIAFLNMYKVAGKCAAISCKGVKRNVILSTLNIILKIF